MKLKYSLLFSLIILLAFKAKGQIGLYSNDTLFVDNDAQMFVEGDFVNEHASFENHGEFTLQGDLENTIELRQVGSGNFRLTGFESQSVTLLGEFKTLNLEIDNSEHVVFSGDSNLSVYGDLEFVDGIFFTRNENLISFKQDALYFDASDFSYIDGPAVKEGLTAFRFPIGKEGRLRPLAISDTEFYNEFQAEYFLETAPTLARETDLESVSDFEYWSFDKVYGFDDPKISLTWDEYSFLNIPGDDLQIAYTPGLRQWSLVEATAQLPEQLENDLTSDEVITDYGLFTFASTNGQTILNDRVIDFELQKLKCSVTVSWEANERSKRISSYSIERSTNGFDFEEIFTVDAINEDVVERYTFEDADLDDLQLYHYRIRSNYFDETDELSTAKFIVPSCYPVTMTLFPNPAYTDDVLTLDVFSEIEKSIEINIVDVLGRILQTRILEIKIGTNRYTIGDTQHYGSAEYFIWTPEIEEIPTLKFQIIR